MSNHSCRHEYNARRGPHILNSQHPWNAQAWFDLGAPVSAERRTGCLRWKATISVASNHVGLSKAGYLYLHQHANTRLTSDGPRSLPPRLTCTQYNRYGTRAPSAPHGLPVWIHLMMHDIKRCGMDTLVSQYTIDSSHCLAFNASC